MLTVFGNDSIRQILHLGGGAKIACQRWNCGVATISLLYHRNSSKEDSASLAMMRDVQKVNWSETSFCSRRLAHGASELEASWRLGQPRSRQTWNPSQGPKSSAAHDGVRIGQKSLVSSHKTAEFAWHGQLYGCYLLNPPRVNTTTSRGKLHMTVITRWEITFKSKRASSPASKRHGAKIPARDTKCFRCGSSWRPERWSWPSGQDVWHLTKAHYNQDSFFAHKVGDLNQRKWGNAILSLVYKTSFLVQQGQFVLAFFARRVIPEWRRADTTPDAFPTFS